MHLMPDLYALADVLLVHLKDDPLFRITIPHKTLTYLSAGKPILTAVEGDVAEVINSNHAGLTCPPGNPDALADTIRKFYNMTLNERETLGENGRKAACNLYGREKMVDKIESMFKLVLARMGD
jgi:glycosyltransferase involved in cell wall biosynthesis